MFRIFYWCPTRQKWEWTGNDWPSVEIAASKADWLWQIEQRPVIVRDYVGTVVWHRGFTG